MHAFRSVLTLTCALMLAAGCGGKKDKPPKADKAVSDAPKKTKTVHRTNTKTYAYALGTRLAIAAAKNADGAAPTLVASELKQVSLFAKLLNVAPPELPPRTKDRTAARASAHKALRTDMGLRVARRLGGLQSKEHAAFFNLAVELQLALWAYDPANKDNPDTAKRLEALAKDAGLDATLAEPATTALSQGKPKAELTPLLQTFEAKVSDHLRKLPPRVVPVGGVKVSPAPGTTAGTPAVIKLGTARDGGAAPTIRLQAPAAKPK